MASKVSDLGQLLRFNEYPGRGIVIGKSADGAKAVFAYFIMGRSENSRNRIFVEREGGIRTEAHDPSKMTDPSLIIYSPVRTLGKLVIVTNGDQTDTIFDHIFKGQSFETALETRCFEPDSPNWTPRISGILDFELDYSYKMSILKAADEQGKHCSRYTFSYEPMDGIGHFIHTYDGNGSPIPSFSGEPETVSVGNDIDEYTKLIWDNLNEANKVSLFVQYIDIDSGKTESRLINKNI